MENLKKLFPLPILALFVLAACTNPLSKEAPAEVVDSPVTVQPVSTEETTPVEILDFSFSSTMTCNLLKNADRRRDCEIQLSEMVGVMLETDIVDSFDAKRCKELPSGVAKVCESSIAESGVQGPVSEEDLAMFNEIMRGSSPDINLENGEGETPFLFPVYDITMCSQLKTSGYKEHCEKLVSERIERNKMDEIFQSDDSSRCDELVSEDNKLECELFFGIGVELELALPEEHVELPEDTSADEELVPELPKEPIEGLLYEELVPEPPEEPVEGLLYEEPTGAEVVQ